MPSDSPAGAVMKSWREGGGEPDLGLMLPQWLGERGLKIQTTRPIVDVITPRSFVWQWPKTFVAVGVNRLVDIGRITADEARAIHDAFAERERAAHTLMITPAVLEIIARAE